MKFYRLVLFSFTTLTVARPAPHGDEIINRETTVDAISEALYGSWQISKRDPATLTKDEAATVDAISEALYASWKISK
ncbi:hypothetical protein BX600DRAFT_447698 [Xylariales sp. PMI_506]|nr:hypothetical protein BX600DRAFT_447698 [Xylariales sp. PMI_506]